MTGRIFRTILLVLVCILVAVFLAIFLFGYLKGYSIRYIYKKLVPGSVEGIYKAVDIIEHDGHESFMTASDGSYVYILEGSDMASYDTKSKDVKYISLDYKNPVLTEAYGLVMVYDKATGAFSIMEEGKTINEGSIGTRCLGANILSENFIGFTLPGGDGFLGSYMIIDSSSDSQGEYSYSDRYPVSACISADGKQLSIAGIEEKNAGMTGIDIYRMGQENPVSGRSFDYLSPMLVSFGGDSFASCGSGNIDILSFGGDFSANLRIDNVILARGGPDGLFVVSGSAGTDTLVMINEDGTKGWERNIPAGTQGIAITSDHVFCWNKTEISILGQDGKVYQLQGEPGTVRDVVTLGEYRIAVLTDANIILYEFN